jgi:hypothetical protein
MSYNVSTNHPLIKNVNSYFLEKKYITIHSEDRDITRYPNSSEFEIMLPQEYLKVASVRLYSWSFPANYNVFSVLNYNVAMGFSFNKLYNPGEFSVSDPLLEGIFAALYDYQNNEGEVKITIETGFYTPYQMATELTNKFNVAVTEIINTFFNNNPVTYAVAKSLFTGYYRFNVVYNSVTQKLFFGNTADKFTLLNKSSSFINSFIVNTRCLTKDQLPETVNWGLPSFLGFSRLDAESFTPEEYLENNTMEANIDNSLTPISDPPSSGPVPRFFYGEAVTNSADNGYWLLPTLTGASVYFLEAPFKINIMGPAYMYMEIDGWNCIDETSPYDVSKFTTQTNKTNSRVNSSFAKIPIPTTPVSQWFDNEQGPYKFWNPPAERISKIKMKLRYHNGASVNFGPFDYSFTLELNLLNPQQERSLNLVSANDLGQVHGYSERFV